MKTIKNSILHHLALWIPIILATPLIIIAQNPDDFTDSLLTQTLYLVGFLALLILISWLIIKLIKPSLQRIFVCIIVAIATVLVIQGYIVHGLFDYGQLDGSIIDWKEFGIAYWLEAVIFILAVIVLSVFYLKIPKQLNTISTVLIIFALAQVALVVPAYLETEVKPIATKDYDDSVFEFSSTSNVIHILADGFQADIVKQVLEENPDLAKEFTGFTFFENHLGRFQSTAPTIPSIFTGKFFDLNKGYNVENVAKLIDKDSYVNTLFDNGYRLDYAGISNIYCHKQANSCVNRSFNDLKSRGYIDNKSILGNLMLLIDISLFRHTPIYMKKSIYNDGAWLMSAKTPRDWSPYPDPIIREWTQKMKVTTTKPVYKWHHFIGTHIPAQWSFDCDFLGRQPQKREYYKDQTFCVLQGMANLFKKLKKENIYDVSTIIINGDHGCNIPANDLNGLSKNRSIYTDSFLGVSRPLFMFKKAKDNNPIVYDNTPTTLEDIAPTILKSVNLPINKHIGQSAFNKVNDGRNKRNFHRYVSNTFWSGNAIAYNEYQVTKDITNRSNWELLGLHNRKKAPSSYTHLSFDTAYDFSKGLSLARSKAKTQKAAPVYGTEFYILLSDTEKEATKLSIELKLYDYSKDQKLSLLVNNTLVVENISFENVYNKWIIKDISIPLGLLKPENNFFKFVFAVAGKNTKDIPVSVTVRSIKLQ